MTPNRRCVGPCGLTLGLDAFPKDGTKRRARCTACYNASRRKAPATRFGRTWEETHVEDFARNTAPRTGALSGVPPVSVESTVRGGDPDLSWRCPALRSTPEFLAEPVKWDHIKIEMPSPPRPVPEILTPVQEHRLRVDNAELKTRLKSLTADLSDAQLMNDVLRAAQAVEVKPIQPRERRSGLLEGTCQVLASDWHIEEEVRPEQVAGRNRYNLEISKRRMTRFFEATRWGLGFNRQAFKIRDLILWLGGDFLTSHLHPDNIETNLLSPPEAIAYAHSSIVEGIKFLLQDPELERIVVPCNDGNHGRMTQKMRSANRTAMSLETMLYGMIAREFANEPRVEFIIAQGSHLYYEVYGRTIRYTHGDETKYGGGVGGITIPIYRAMSRWQTVRHADLSVLGHYHQRTSLTDLIINGSLIGYSPYSLTIGARFEPPAQDMTMLDPKRFKGLSMPLWVSERADDSEDQETA